MTTTDSPARATAAGTDNPAPETLEGFYVLHDVYDLDWPRWRRLAGSERQQQTQELQDWLQSLLEYRQRDAGDGACYRLVGQKGELLFLHYRLQLAELAEAQRQLRGLQIFDLLIPRYGYTSVIEASLYEATGRAHGILAGRGLNPHSPGWAEAYEAELAQQKRHLHERVFRPIPDKSHICFYPMNKRRGEQINWYDTPLEERRLLMRGHGRIGHKYFEAISQVISGSIGLDDWEWSVDLHGDDPLQFKKLIYEMRFDPASSRYAEFGPFYVGMLTDAEALGEYLQV